ncbi:MAG TPA: YoaK family protein [Rhizomicrobium sp.]|jgi:uncharacterized membrane protein YoaK (UPF0700 family)|nr:YoaK family protein [Rhizomicrobium sp.]
MIRHDRTAQAMAVALSTLAGYVDAIGFITLGGFFVSFMSGNSTRFAVGLVHGAPSAFLPLALIGVFVAGVMLGSLVGHIAAARRRPAVLSLIAVLLAAAALLGVAAPRLSAFVLALAMGAENAVFERDGEVQIGLTYMTGTLVKFGQRAVGALLGGERWAWAPYLLLWLGLVTGALAGAILFSRLGPGALWIAAGAAAMLGVVALRADQKMVHAEPRS